MATHETIAKMAATLSVQWPDKAPRSTAQLDVWHEILKDKPDALVLAAARQWIADSRWCPTPADIRQIVARLELGDVHSESHAWHRIQAYIRNSAIREDTPKEHLSEREIFAVESAGGFWELRFGSQPGAFRRRFETAYNESIEQDTRRLIELPSTRELLGLPEPVNEKPLRLEDGGHRIGEEK
jgi:hypothetical protein